MENNNVSKEYLEKLITGLIDAGEDREELSLWRDLYDVLSREELRALLDNLEKELKNLKEAK